MGVDEMQDFKLKPMKCELNYLSKSDGSAILAQGETVVLASVNGPLDIKTQSQNVEKANVEILFMSKEGKPCLADRYKENIIRQTCETAILGSLYPRTGINVTVQELEDFGGLLPCAVNCACLALLNSGVALRSVFAAVACAVLPDGELLLQPGAAQQAAARATLTFVFDGRDKSLITGFTEGIFGEDVYNEALERCRLASDLVFNFYRDIVTKYSEVVAEPPIGVK